MTEGSDKKQSVLAPLDKAAYEQASVPSREELRSALKQGAAELREAALQPKPSKVDPKIRFR